MERFKDANACLMGGVTAEVMRGCLASAVDFAPKKVVSAAEFYDAFMAEWFERHLEPGFELPWNFPFKIRMGELTVWTGIEKSGKTTVLGFVLIALLAQGERALVASFEVTPVKTLKKLSRQTYGGLLFDKRKEEQGAKSQELGASQEPAGGAHDYRSLAMREAEVTFAWMAERLWIYNHVGIGNWRELGEDIRWARRRHGITEFVIDNFMRLGIVKDDYAQQAEAITYFAGLAMELGAHIHVVVHQNKSEGHKGAGGKRTVSGAFEIIANAHNIVEVQRDEKKGERVSELFEKRKIGQIGQTEFEEEKRKLDLVPDGKFVLHAQRDGEHQNGSKYLWFLWESQQYADKPPGHREHAAIRFVEREGTKGPKD